VAKLHNSTTPEQRRHGLERLRGWEDDLRALAAQRHQDPVDRERIDRP